MKQNAQQMMMEKMMQQMMSGKVSSLAGCASLSVHIYSSKPRAFSPFLSAILLPCLSGPCSVQFQSSRTGSSVVWHILRLEQSLHTH